MNFQILGETFACTIQLFFFSPKFMAIEQNVKQVKFSASASGLSDDSLGQP